MFREIDKSFKQFYLSSPRKAIVYFRLVYENGITLSVFPLSLSVRAT
jgi:hypothetical protein